jgi:hypothetical protein
MREQKASVGHVVATTVQRPRVANSELRVGQSSSQLVLPGERDDRGIEIDADRPPRRTNDAREIEGCMTAPTADVDAHLSLADTGHVEQLKCGRSHDLSEQVQPPFAINTTGNRVLILSQSRGRNRRGHGLHLARIRPPLTRGSRFGEPNRRPPDHKARAGRVELAVATTIRVVWMGLAALRGKRASSPAAPYERQPVQSPLSLSLRASRSGLAGAAATIALREKEQTPIESVRLRAADRCTSSPPGFVERAANRQA